MRAFLGLGSNAGASRVLIARALDELEQRGVRVVRRSALYETEPVGGPPRQPWFINQVVEVSLDGSVRVLFGITQRIERVLGRDRSKEIHWGPRPIDVDILLADETIDEPDLHVPHLRLKHRRFALEPLAEIAPDAELPTGESVKSLLDALPEQPSVRRVGAQPNE